MHRPSSERVAFRFLASWGFVPPPAPHPRSDVGSTLKGLIDSLDDYLRNEGNLFYRLYDDASEQDFILVDQLRTALKRKNQAAAKRYAEALSKVRSSAKTITNDNMLWTYVLDGRESI